MPVALPITDTGGCESSVLTGQLTATPCPQYVEGILTVRQPRQTPSVAPKSRGRKRFLDPHFRKKSFA